MCVRVFPSLRMQGRLYERLNAGGQVWKQTQSFRQKTQRANTRVGAKIRKGRR